MSAPNLTQQASAVDLAARIVSGAAKLPRVTTSEAALLLERLRAALATIRKLENSNG